MADHSSIYYFNGAMAAKNYPAAVPYLISAYTSGVQPYKSASGHDIMYQEQIPQLLIATMDNNVGGIYDYLKAVGFLSPNPQVEDLIKAGKIIPNDNIIASQTVAADSADAIVKKTLPNVNATIPKNNLLLYGGIAAGGLLLILLLRKKHKK